MHQHVIGNSYGKVVKAMPLLVLHDFYDTYKEAPSVLLTMTSLSASLPLAISATKVRRTGTLGTTTRKEYNSYYIYYTCHHHNYVQISAFSTYTTNQGENDDILNSGNVDKDDYHFIKYEQGLSTHPPSLQPPV